MNGVRRVAGNAASMLASDAANRGAVFFLYAMVARYLGALGFGQLALALTLFQTFQLLAGAGLQQVVTREVAKHKEETSQYLVNGSAVVAVFSVASVVILAVLVRALNYSPDTTAVISLLSLGLLPNSLSLICDAVFQAWERMYYITYANGVVNVAKVALGYLMLSQGYGLNHLVILLFFLHVAGLGVRWWLMLRRIVRPRARIDPRFGLGMSKIGVTFLGINATSAVWTSFNPIVLSKLTSEVEVGLFSAVYQLMVPITLVLESTTISVFPLMCRRFEPSFQILKQIAERLLELLLMLVLPMAVGLFFLADWALLLFYGDEDFLAASGALRIMVWILILRVFTQVAGRVLVASLREKATLRILLVNLLANVLCGPILIAQFGLTGAALTVLLVRIVDFLQHYVRVSRLFSGILLTSLVWKPAVASACMALYLSLMRDQGVLLTIVSASMVYVAVLSVLTVWSVGGPRRLKARYLYLWSE